MFITGCTGSCQNDNFQCSQWWKFRQNDDIFVSVVIFPHTDNPQSTGYNKPKKKQLKLEQLERLRSEDTPRRLMITHTIESYWIPSQKRTKSKLKI